MLSYKSSKLHLPPDSQPLLINNDIYFITNHAIMRIQLNDLSKTPIKIKLSFGANIGKRKYKNTNVIHFAHNHSEILYVLYSNGMIGVFTNNEYGDNWKMVTDIEVVEPLDKGFILYNSIHHTLHIFTGNCKQHTIYHIKSKQVISEILFNNNTKIKNVEMDPVYGIIKMYTDTTVFQYETKSIKEYQRIRENSIYALGTHLYLGLSLHSSNAASVDHFSICPFHVMNDVVNNMKRTPYAYFPPSFFNTLFQDKNKNISIEPLYVCNGGNSRNCVVLKKYIYELAKKGYAEIELNNDILTSFADILQKNSKRNQSEKMYIITSKENENDDQLKIIFHPIKDIQNEENAT
eukprot:303530_1